MAEQHVMNENLSWTLDIMIFNHLDREFLIGHFFLCHHSNCPHSASLWFHIYNRTVLNRSLQIQLNNYTEIYCLCQFYFILYSPSSQHTGINIFLNKIKCFVCVIHFLHSFNSGIQIWKDYIFSNNSFPNSSVLHPCFNFLSTPYIESGPTLTVKTWLSDLHLILLPGQANHTCGLWLEGFLLFPHFLPQALPPKQEAGWSRGTHLSETEAGGRVEVILLSLISDLPEGLWMWWSPHLSTLLTCINKNSMSFLINLKSFQSMRVRLLLAEVKALRVGYDC